MDKELKDELEPAQQEAQDKIAALRALQEHPGWAVLHELLDPEIERRQKYILLQPSTSVEDAIGREFLKGESAGWVFLLELPELQIETYEEVLELFKLKRRQEREANEHEDTETQD